MVELKNIKVGFLDDKRGIFGRSANGVAILYIYHESCVINFPKKVNINHFMCCQEKIGEATNFRLEKRKIHCDIKLYKRRNQMKAKFIPIMTDVLSTKISKNKYIIHQAELSCLLFNGGMK